MDENKLNNICNNAANCAKVANLVAELQKQLLEAEEVINLIVTPYSGWYAAQEKADKYVAKYHANTNKDKGRD